MIERALRNPKIEIIWNHELVRVEGDNVVRAVILKDVKTNTETKREAGGVFFAIGHDPNTKFLGGQVAVNEKGYIKVTAGSTFTNVEGVFAAGDVQDPVYRQAISAAGSGCMAALDAERWLSSKGLID